MVEDVALVVGRGVNKERSRGRVRSGKNGGGELVLTEVGRTYKVKVGVDERERWGGQVVVVVVVVR